MVYPTLTLLQEMGLTESQTQGTRKIYAITEQGQKELADNQPRIQAILQRMQEIGQKHANERPPQLVRAFENLKMAVQIHSGKWTPDLLASATEILDQAARQIERL
jgi:DNA-binding PadR family transcriptional regulator